MNELIIKQYSTNHKQIINQYKPAVSQHASITKPWKQPWKPIDKQTINHYKPIKPNKKQTINK